MNLTEVLAQEFGLKVEYSQNIINLLDEGCTIPFIARYRKEMHGTCDDQTLRAFADRLKYLRNLNEEKAKVETEVDSVKKALEGTDTEAIKQATEKLTTAFYAISEKLYAQAQEQAGANPNANSEGPKTDENGNVYDADYKVEDDDKKE